MPIAKNVLPKQNAKLLLIPVSLETDAAFVSFTIRLNEQCYQISFVLTGDYSV